MSLFYTQIITEQTYEVETMKQITYKTTPLNTKYEDLSRTDALKGTTSTTHAVPRV